MIVKHAFSNICHELEIEPIVFIWLAIFAALLMLVGLI